MTYYCPECNKLLQEINDYHYKCTCGQHYYRKDTEAIPCQPDGTPAWRMVPRGYTDTVMED